MDSILEVNNISKLYRLGEIGTGTLGNDLKRWFQKTILQQQDPYLKIGKENNRNIMEEGDVFYSLNDISFSIRQGESLGIIGRNGAGKSTLLKILSRITSPTTGSLKIKGRVTSLLEVGTGFHPDLTGRENIFLNGAILGMRKKEIARKLDSIIDFSGIGSFIDTPVRRYSSGMYVRLAFSVAAHLESEILILDEVLSVGDFEFQKKCTDKMNELKNAEGKTIILVSHNIDAIRTFCKKSLFLENGRLKMFDETNLVADAYMRVHHEGFEYKTNLVEIKFQSKSFDIINFGIRNGECPPFDKPISRDKSIRFEFNYIKKTVAENNFVVFKYKDIEGNYICTMDSYNQLLIDKQGEGRVVMKTHPFFFNTGKYRVDLFIHGIFEDGVRPIFEQRDILNFEVVASTMLFSENLGVDEGYLHPVTNWRIEENNQV